MARASVALRVWMAIIAIAIVAMPVNGAHLHLCFDGGEPPATVHSMDDGAHHEESGADVVHRDVDVSIASSALAKKFDQSLHLPGLIATALFVLRVPVTGAVVPLPDRSAVLVPEPELRLLPPLRGPPA
jgi:hypothetical protein